MRIFPHTLLCVACAAAASAQTATTFNRDDYAAAAPARPRAVALADFDRDGYIDLALAGARDASVVLTLNRARTGQGFVRFRTITVGGGPFEMAAGDLNRDGWPDLAIANADLEGVTLLLSTGMAGAFTQVDYLMPGASPRGIALGDRNRDGKLDVIVTEYATGAWRILYGDGAGAIARDDRYGGIKNPQGVVAADFNRDGWLDVAMAGAGINIVAVFSSTSTGGIVQKNVYVDGAVSVLASGDYNRDGWLDLAAVSTSNGAIYTLFGGPNGLAWKGTVYSGSSPRGIVAVDVNQDGWLDLATANRASSTVNVHLGLASSPGSFTSASSLAAGSGSRAIAAADFDHDGRVDLASANEFGESATVLLNATSFVRNAYVFSERMLGEDTGSGGGEALCVEDFNGNGAPDAAILTWEGPLIFMDGGASTVRLAHPLKTLRCGDLNADGRADLLGIDVNTGQLTALLGNGRGAFPTLKQQNIGLTGDVRLGDFNRDGRLDVLLESHDGTAWTFRVMNGRGDGTFAQTSEIRLPTWANGIAVADVNRDARLDVVAGHYNPAGVSVLLGDGAGGWSGGPTFYPTPAGIAPVAVADVDQDGAIDVLAGTFDTLQLLAGNGDGTLRAPVEQTVPWMGDFAVGDINLDGHVDVATTAGDMLFGRGDGTFDLSRFAESGSTPVIHDFNGDGLPDVLLSGMGWLRVMVNERNETNRPPIVRTFGDQEIPYQWEFDEFSIGAEASDPDLHELRFEWRTEDGRLVGTYQWFYPEFLFPPGRHTLIVTAFDDRGGQASDSMVLTVLPFKEIVTPAAAFTEYGAWRRVEDASASEGVRMQHPNAGAPKVPAPLADPVDYIEVWFPADPTQTYKLWIRLKAERDNWANDSVYVQFSGAVDVGGNAVCGIGTTSALTVNLEECPSCGLSGWGWEDDAYGKDRNGTTLRFPAGGWQRIRIQTREDGVSIDQVVLSSEKYLAARPGLAKNDQTILASTNPYY